MGRPRMSSVKKKLRELEILETLWQHQPILIKRWNVQLKITFFFFFSFFCFRTKERTKQIYEKISIWLRRKLWWSWWSWWWCWRDDNDSEWLWQYFPCDRRTRITWDLWLSPSLSFSRLDKNDMWSPLNEESRHPTILRLEGEIKNKHFSFGLLV